MILETMFPYSCVHRLSIAEKLHMLWSGTNPPGTWTREIKVTNLQGHDAQSYQSVSACLDVCEFLFFLKICSLLFISMSRRWIFDYYVILFSINYYYFTYLLLLFYFSWILLQREVLALRSSSSSFSFSSFLHLVLLLLVFFLCFCFFFSIHLLGFTSFVFCILVCFLLLYFFFSSSAFFSSPSSSLSLSPSWDLYLSFLHVCFFFYFFIFSSLSMFLCLLFSCSPTARYSWWLSVARQSSDRRRFGRYYSATSVRSSVVVSLLPPSL